MNITTANLLISFERSITDTDIIKIKKCISQSFTLDILISQKDADGQFLYLYPKVQFKKINDNTVLIIGILDGIKTIEKINNNILKINFDKINNRVKENRLEYRPSLFGISFNTEEYKFIIPWFALNPANYQLYKSIGNDTAKKVFLERILSGNIISMSKGIGYTVNKIIRTQITDIQMTKEKINNASVIGFIGKFKVNFHIPDYLGIGRLVSKGFGTVVKITDL